MNLYAVVYTDELEKDGRSAVYFNIRTPNAAFGHYAVVQDKSGAQTRTVAALLAKVCQHHPKAGTVDSQRTVWIVRERAPLNCPRCGKPDGELTPDEDECRNCQTANL